MPSQPPRTETFSKLTRVSKLTKLTPAEIAKSFHNKTESELLEIVLDMLVFSKAKFTFDEETLLALINAEIYRRSVEEYERLTKGSAKK